MRYMAGSAVLWLAPPHSSHKNKCCALAFIAPRSPNLVLRTPGSHPASSSIHIEKAPACAEAFSMAGSAGFEPANDGTKTRCLTAWRRPINLYDYVVNWVILSI